MKWHLPLIVAILFNAGANIMMKWSVLGVTESETQSVVDKLLARFINIPFLVGLAFFGVALIFYQKSLENLNLSIAYPLMTSAGLLIVTAWSVFVFKEALAMHHILGIVAITGGIWLLSI
ncbi:small multidrug resistance protein [bacterium]|nr:small multidrug resistance protein [bacterium]